MHEFWFYLHHFIWQPNNAHKLASQLLNFETRSENSKTNFNVLANFLTNFLLFLCLVLLQVPKCFGLVQIFCARQKIYLHIVAVTNILCQTKRWFAFSKIGFCANTKVFEEVLNAVLFLGWLKKFGPAQNILGPVKGQGIRTYLKYYENPYLSKRYSI